jgi:SAM-dependent methyltransferase
LRSIVKILTKTASQGGWVGGRRAVAAGRFARSTGSPEVLKSAQNRALVHEAADVIINNFEHAWAYYCQFRFGLAVYQRVLMRNIDLERGPSLEIGINDGSSASIAHFGKPKFTWGGDMPEENTYESMGLHIEPQFDMYENVIGLDAHQLPFPDNSFNVVVTNDMLGYGVNREKILDEMIRVLAPGGTLFLSEATAKLCQYPHQFEALKVYVPTAQFIHDPVGFYRDLMSRHGMQDIAGRTYFDHRLCTITYGNLFRGETLNPVTPEKKGFYNETLRAMADLLADDLEGPDTGGGWQAYMTCRKPGMLERRQTPNPMCLECRGPLSVTLRACRCENCGRSYRSDLGNPHVLNDYGKTYSPKSTAVDSLHARAVRIADEIAAATTRGGTAHLNTFDKMTRFIIRILRERDITVSVVYSDNPLFVGRSVLGVPIQKTPIA